MYFQTKGCWMKTAFISMIIILAYLMLLFASIGIALAFLAPSHPGSIVFPIQDFMEQQIKFRYSAPDSRADYLLNLVERRIDDLSKRAGTKYEVLSIEYLNKSFDQAIEEISMMQDQRSSSQHDRLITLAQDANNVLGKLHRTPGENMEIFDAIQAKVQTLIHITSEKEVLKEFQSLIPIVSAEPGSQTNIDTVMGNLAVRIIPFPQGSVGAIHSFYPLLGQHAVTECVSCHNSGRYAGIPNQCVSCHILEQPVDHYFADCALCHSAISWTDIHFDHESVAPESCQTCHFSNIPENHYSGNCSACHITQNWLVVNFDHQVANAVDCLACHGRDLPVNHYAGQCSNCHNSKNWASATFNHSGFTDCYGCHNVDTPGNHYSGQCSNCHATSGSWANAHFNHNGYSDCQACHAGSAPANHFAGQCSNCHNTNSWGGASFNHAGFTDCISCHQKDRPREHSGGQCSECHNTSRWGDADDD
jgi:hypothetical protein